MIFFTRRQIRVRTAGMIVKEGKILLIAHRKNKKKYWLVPGGGIDFGESAEDALVREMQEELGIDVEIGDIIFSSDSIDPSGSRHVLNLYFSCTHTGGEITLGDDPRLSDWGYFSAEEIPALKLSPPCAQQLICFLRGIHQPVYQGSAWEE